MRTRKTSLFFILFFSIFAYAQQNKASDAKKTAYKTETSIAYRDAKIESLDDYAKQQCRLDLYYPVDQPSFKTVIWLHGGGLTDGEKEIPEELKQLGVAVVGVGYRKSPQVKCDLILDDAAAAVAWVLKNISKYGGDSKNVILSGYSAGGYLALMVAMDKSWLANYQVDANMLTGIVAISPQVITHFAIRKERGIPATRALVDEFAPLYHVRNDLPPLMLVTGDRELEMLGRYEENAYLKRMLILVGCRKTELYELDGFDHGGMLQPALRLFVKHIARLNSQ